MPGGLDQMSQIDPMLIAALGSMAGTLPQGGSQTSSEGLDDQLQQQIAQRAKDAAAAASQAGSQYQQAAAQPAPGGNPMAAGLGSLFGNVASQLTQNPNYMQEAHQSIRDQQATLAQNRLQNLQALKDQADQKARAAEQLGNTEVAGLARIQSERFANTMKMIHDDNLQQLIEGRQTDLEKLKQEGRLDLASIKAKLGTGNTPQDIDVIKQEIEAGRQPPTFVGMGRSGGVVALRSALGKDHFDLDKATLDFGATQRYLATLNGRQQVQIAQSARTVQQQLDNIEGLSNELQKYVPRGDATPLNKIALGLATEWGAMGSPAQVAASNLMIQLKETIPDIANVLQAGGVPTDQAMKLASGYMDGSWSVPRLAGGIKTTRQNLGYRLNSISSGSARDENGQPIVQSNEAASDKPLASELMRASQITDAQGLMDFIHDHPAIAKDPQIIALARKVAVK